MYYNIIMREIIGQILKNEKIEYFGIIPFSVCKVINSELLNRYMGDTVPKSVIMLIVPYYSGEHPSRNVSLYAIPRDYHIYFKEMYERVEGKLKEAFCGYTFKGFADHSPIAETHPASMAGLGVIGDMYQLINEKYGSHVFIGEIFTDMELDAYDTVEPSFCSHCGACKAACPSPESCLSAITQRKGALTVGEVELIRKSGIAWGCDVCRLVCPMNNDVQPSPIDFFKENLTERVTAESINSMSKSEFSQRAYSWRGKSTIIRNIMLLDE